MIRFPLEDMRTQDVSPRQKSELERTIVPTASALTSAPNDPEVVAEILASASRNAYETTTARRNPQPFGRFRRNSVRASGEAQRHDEELDEEADLQLQVMLLREENARLKAGRHRPSDVGTMIDELRLVASEEEGDLLDDAWSLLSECLVIREGLAQACVEIENAVGSVRQRLATLVVRIEGLARDDSSVPAGASGGRASEAA
jgi:hypothetical protein